jgi:hypothetical protein
MTLHSSAYTRIVILCLLIILYNPLPVQAQANPRVLIDKSVKEYCDCIAAAKDQSEIYSCHLEIDTVSNPLTEYDKFYVFVKMIRQCGDAQQRFADHPTDLTETENFFVKGCTHLTPGELSKFRLKRKLTSLAETMQMIETYEPVSRNLEKQIVLEFRQSRYLIANLDSLVNSNRNQDIDLSRQVPDSVIKAPAVFDYVAVGFVEESNGIRYSVVATKGKLLCNMILLLSSNELSVVKEFLALLEEKIINCQF